jgi:hypothetical protein
MNTVKPPKRLKVRPQWRGLPIPYIALIDAQGQPDFRVTDENKRASVIRNRWCQLCGEPLGKWMFFVGGPEAAKANQYFEPAAHLDCLIYAMQVCPFIVGRIEHADVNKIAAKHEGTGIEVVKEVIPARNPYWVIKKATSYSLLKAQGGNILLYPHAVKETKPLHAESMTPADWRKVMKELL